MRCTKCDGGGYEYCSSSSKLCEACAGSGREPAPTRTALVIGETVGRVAAYMPSNYTATETADGDVLISGTDSAGWTLEGYVIPRLASGLIFAQEVTP